CCVAMREDVIVTIVYAKFFVGIAQLFEREGLAVVFGEIFDEGNAFTHDRTQEQYGRCFGVFGVLLNGLSEGVVKRLEIMPVGFEDVPSVGLPDGCVVLVLNVGRF